MAKNDNKKKKTLQIGGTDVEKKKALDVALSEIEKSFGKGAIMKLGERPAIDIDTISTGCMDLDVALGIGGLPRGRIIEIYGPESSGKTTLTLHIIAEAQKEHGTCAFIDAEHALDPVYARKLGVDTDNLYISQPDTGEQALEITEALVRSGALDVIVLDSVAALVPKAEIDGLMGESHMGLHARLMSQALRKLAGIVHKTNCMVIFINQLRVNLGGYGSPETTTGGRALKFYASIRIDVRKGDSIHEGAAKTTPQIGNQTKIKIVKNKLAPPFRIAYCDMIFGEGISREASLAEVATSFDVIHKSGSWFSYKDQRIGQGRDNVRKFLKENPEIYAEVDAAVREKMAAEPALAKAVTDAANEKSQAKKGKGAKGAKDAPVEEEIPSDEDALVLTPEELMEGSDDDFTIVTEEDA